MCVNTGRDRFKNYKRMQLETQLNVKRECAALNFKQITK